MVVTDTLERARKLANASYVLENGIRNSLVALDLKAANSASGLRNIAHISDEIRMLVEKNGLPRWAVAAICFLPLGVNAPL